MIGIIVEEVNEWLNKAEHTDLATLARIEESVVNKYSGFDGFEAFGYGSFLKFLDFECHLIVCWILYHSAELKHLR